MSEKTELGPCTPFFVVSNLEQSIAHYVDRLGFECRLVAPESEPFFAILARGSAQIMIKKIGDSVKPSPNHERHEWARWDAFIHASEPDSLASEFSRRKVRFHRELSNTDENLRGFEIADPDGYVCFFGRPI